MSVWHSLSACLSHRNSPSLLSNCLIHKYIMIDERWNPWNEPWNQRRILILAFWCSHSPSLSVSHHTGYLVGHVCISQHKNNSCTKFHHAKIHPKHSWQKGQIRMNHIISSNPSLFWASYTLRQQPNVNKFSKYHKKHLSDWQQLLYWECGWTFLMRWFGNVW